MKTKLMILMTLSLMALTRASSVELEPSVRAVPSMMVETDEEVSKDVSKFVIPNIHVGWGDSSGGWGGSSGGWGCTKTHTVSLRSTSTVTTGTVTKYTSTITVSAQTPTTSTSSVCATSASVCRNLQFRDIKPTAVQGPSFDNTGTAYGNRPNVINMVTAMYNTLKDYIEANEQ